MSASETPFRIVGDVEDVERWPVAAFYVEELKHRVAVARIGDSLYAFDDLCTHDDCSLASGRLVNEHHIMCQCGGCQFDVRTGSIVRGPATEPLKSYEARENGGKLEVRI